MICYIVLLQNMIKLKHIEDIVCIDRCNTQQLHRLDLVWSSKTQGNIIRL